MKRSDALELAAQFGAQETDLIKVGYLETEIHAGLPVLASFIQWVEGQLVGDEDETTIADLEAQLDRLADELGEVRTGLGMRLKRLEREVGARANSEIHHGGFHCTCKQCCEAWRASG